MPWSDARSSFLVIPDGDGPPTGKPGNRCPRAADSPGGQPSVTEDCLYLNVTTPAKSGPSRPVMVWLHGGDGIGAGADYDPTRLVDQGNVTVFGEPSGAFATCALLSAPQANGLVERAIMESSSCSAYFAKNALAPGLGRHTLFTPLQGAQAAGTAAAAKIAAAYPARGTGPFAASLSWAAATTDDGWDCPTAADAQALASAGRPVYTYFFADENAPPIPGYAVPQGFPLGAAHGLEMGYLSWEANGNAAQQRLSRKMIGYWTNFARTGDPTGAGLPTWPKFSEGARVQRFAPDRVGPIDPQAQSKCSLWRQLGV
ncbi:carboxylesterase family protein [Amycolatopsis sp. NPDC047767]|uniref:carboxylesterase family protein n=1 Tax=Amycolatopsis sp. NPDC047767 TaxID=3156765 RepID=UPI00345616B5